MLRIEIQLITGLLLIASSVMSAPNRLDDVSKSNVITEDIPNIESNRNDLSPPNGDVNAEIPDDSRTLIMYGMLQWLLGVFKAIISPVRNMYITMLPEITAFRCLSESREFQNIMEFSGSDFEGYVYDTPRTTGRTLPSIDETSIEPNDGGFTNEINEPEFHQNDHSETRNFPKDPYDPKAYSISQTTLHHTDHVLKRIPRFIDEFGSLLKDGQAMNCIMPYMKERVTRWLDS